MAVDGLDFDKIGIEANLVPQDLGFLKNNISKIHHNPLRGNYFMSN